MDFGGKTYDPAFDRERLQTQLGRVYALMIDGVWRTLGEIARVTGDPEASISARLRDLRKEKFGGYRMEARRRGDPKRGLWEYQVSEPGDNGEWEVDTEPAKRLHFFDENVQSE